jgi:hypothetical protein
VSFERHQKRAKRRSWWFVTARDDSLDGMLIYPWLRWVCVCVCVCVCVLFQFPFVFAQMWAWALLRSAFWLWGVSVCATFSICVSPLKGHVPVSAHMSDSSLHSSVCEEGRKASCVLFIPACSPHPLQSSLALWSSGPSHSLWGLSFVDQNCHVHLFAHQLWAWLAFNFNKKPCWLWHP